MNLEDLTRVVQSVGQRRGWDFSRLNVDRDPVPWKYEEVVRRFLRSNARALDVGTGGGEVFLSLAPHFKEGLGIDQDPEMIRVAGENRAKSGVPNVSFMIMKAEHLKFPVDSFDIVLNRYSEVHVNEVVRVLKPEGYFITQQVAGNDAQNIFDAFGWGSNGEYWNNYYRQKGEQPLDVDALVRAFREAVCHIVARAEYNVPYYFRDVESLVFWLKSVPLPEEFDVEKHLHQVNELLTKFSKPRGILSNEHRELLVVRKREFGI